MLCVALSVAIRAQHVKEIGNFLRTGARLLGSDAGLMRAASGHAQRATAPRRRHLPEIPDRDIPSPIPFPGTARAPRWERRAPVRRHRRSPVQVCTRTPAPLQLRERGKLRLIHGDHELAADVNRQTTSRR